MVEQVGRARGPAYALRLEDLLEAAAVTAVCQACDRAVPFDFKKLIANERRYGPHERLVRVEDRLRCSRCGARAPVACKLRVTWEKS